MAVNRTKTALVLLMIVASWFYGVKAECCYQVTSIEKNCSNGDIYIAGQMVPQNSTDARIKLPHSQKSIDWFCGSIKGTIDSATPVNQLRVSHHSDATVHLTLFSCDKITGPFEAGVQCAVQEVSWTCPSSASLGCVYELTTDTTRTQSISIKKMVTGEVAAGVRASAVEVTGKTAVGAETTVSGSKIVSTSQGYYLEIPAGISFCAYKEAISVKDVHAPSGFAWRCSLTKFREIPFTLDSDPTSCSDLYHCDDDVCDANAYNSPDTCRSCTIPVFSLLTWTAMVVVNAENLHF